MSSADVTREILGNVPGWLVPWFYGVIFAAYASSAVIFVQRFRERRGATTAPSDRARVLDVIKYLTFHQKLLEDRFAGIAHLCTFYGFVALFMGTSIVFLEHSTPLHFFYGAFYLWASLFVDLGGLVFIVGLLMFLWQRYVSKRDRLLSRWWVATLTWLLLAIAISGFLLEGSRIAVDMPAFESFSVVGYAIAGALRFSGVENETALLWHRALWVGHAVVSSLFFALLPWPLFSHMVYSGASWGRRRTRPLAELRTSAPVLTWIDLMQTDACTTCGRCNEVCPAQAVGQPLAPRDIVLGIRQAVTEAGPSVSYADQVGRFSHDVIWSCTTCGACNQTCPVGIDVYDEIIDLRRGLVEQGTVPEAAEELFEGTAAEFNPFHRDNDERMDWAQGLGLPVARDGEAIELLYWVGCAGSFDPDGQSVSRAMVTILDHLDIPYRILGCRERCTGDPARRMGEEGLFQERARENIDLLASHSVRKVLTHCPHCYNTFKNEYPELGGAFEVEHHSQFLDRLIASGKLPVTEGGSQPLTFHDPCYLGRGNGETEAPRRVIDAVAGGERREMARHGRESFCCGAGGGAMWLDVQGKDRVENLRVKEAAETGARTLVTGCPFCKVMLESGQQSLEDDQRMQVKDLAELVAERLTPR
ncbi:MAG: 4Fe-4S dicluster domain-containing protein [Acidobacteria bacterium]|nr:MAG: 4Fe-4S dicluster domain-containing protein [Acidobacteriota bacterium]